MVGRERERERGVKGDKEYVTKKRKIVTGKKG